MRVREAGVVLMMMDTGKRIKMMWIRGISCGAEEEDDEEEGSGGGGGGGLGPGAETAGCRHVHPSISFVIKILNHIL